MYHTITLFRITEVWLYTLLVSVAEGMNGGFMPQTLGGYTQNGRPCGPQYWSGRSSEKDSLALLEKEARFESVSAHTLNIIP